MPKKRTSQPVYSRFFLFFCLLSLLPGLQLQLPTFHSPVQEPETHVYTTGIHSSNIQGVTLSENNKNLSFHFLFFESEESEEEADQERKALCLHCFDLSNHPGFVVQDESTLNLFELSYQESTGTFHPLYLNNRVLRI